MAYLLDKSVFLQAKNLYYQMIFCPAFWEWMKISSKKGIIFTTDKVFYSLQKNEHDIGPWLIDLKGSLAKSTQFPLQQIGDKIRETFRSGTYLEGAEHAFMCSDDFFLVALALANNYTIVSNVEKNDKARAEVNLPYLCYLLKINCITPFDMLKKENPRFVLDRN